MMYILSLGIALLTLLYQYWPSSSTLSVSQAKNCCSLLSVALPEQVFFPGTTAYFEQQEYYSKEQESDLPSCRVSPRNALDVSRILSLSTTNRCHYAVKSGGHMAWSGASNIGPSGFTIDLGQINQVSLSDNKRVVSIAGGAIWSAHVYPALAPHNLTTVGSRSAGVGVGGFLIHGGISFLSTEQGFGSDNVLRYEMVLANGSLVGASLNENADLYWAMKQGSTNFGIVTRFEMSTYPIGEIWAGAQVHDISAAPALLAHLAEFTDKLDDDPKGMTAVGMAYSQALGRYVIWAPVMYFKPIEFPALFAGMEQYEPLASSVRVCSLGEMAEEVLRSAPGGGRAQWFSFTIQTDAQFAWALHLDGKEMFKELVDIPGASWALTFQPINKRLMSAGTRNGGNPSRMKEGDGNLFLILGSVFWDQSRDDRVMKAFTDDLIDHIDRAARARQVLHPFIYMNYALGSQDVYGGMDVENFEKMRAVKRVYDPENVFGKYWHGGFKLPM